MRLSAEDIFDIQQLVSEITYMVDERNWDDLERLYTEDGIFDASLVGYASIEGQAALRKHMKSANHPLAHYTTNTVVRPIDANSANVVSMIIGAWQDGTMTAGATYRDHVVRTSKGWQMKCRQVVPGPDYTPRL
ncbi:hypothetical protein J2W40_003295 [Sphingobium xenophagum]|uniref:SnoaL-like domain-containing protein n=1 Tax=Sphingobium xenophagum TaxID=121428 RepID=A0ABU1X5P1_SPHXE|nr:nuclear transport factor 2 family protein [Sphingobium xenophagum]MDR7156451.1 hypothetical protein [Sphingobium xenophagum]